MSVSRFRADASRTHLGEVHDRMLEIMGLIKPTQSALPITEYSALLAAAAFVLAANSGMELTPENCSKILGLMADKVIPAITAEVKATS